MTLGRFTDRVGRNSETTTRRPVCHATIISKMDQKWKLAATTLAAVCCDGSARLTAEHSGSVSQSIAPEMSAETAFLFSLLTFAGVVGSVYAVDDILDGASTLDFTKGHQLTSLNADASPAHSPLLIADVKDPASGTFKVIGDVAMSRPCCVSWGPGRVDCFYRSSVSGVHHWWKQDGIHHKKMGTHKCLRIGRRRMCQRISRKPRRVCIG